MARKFCLNNYFFGPLVHDIAARDAGDDVDTNNDGQTIFASTVTIFGKITKTLINDFTPEGHERQRTRSKLLTNALVRIGDKVGGFRINQELDNGEYGLG